MVALLPLLTIAAALPHIVMIVVDDLGSHDLGYTGSEIKTPAIDALRKDGLELTNYYVQRLCSPSRACFLSGRYAFHHGVDNWIPSASAWAVPSDNQFVGGHLKEAGYSTHAIGKWHVGFSSWKYTPTFKGFDTFTGFYSGVEGYFSHMVAGGYDMRHDSRPNCGENCTEILWDVQGEYSTNIFGRAAVQVIEQHNTSTPLFMYLAFQGVHGPQEVPDSYVAPYLNTSSRPHFAGMVAAVDEGVMNVTKALAKKKMTKQTIIVVTADNGGPVWIDAGADSVDGDELTWPAEHEGDAIGASNYPKRGGKHLLYDGGVRVSGIIHAPGFITPPKSGDGVYTNLMHASDWFATFASFAGLPVQPSGHAPSGKPWRPIDGVSHMEAMASSLVAPPRDTIVLDNQSHYTTDEYGLNVGIVVVQGDDQWKLIINSTDSGWSQRMPVDAVNSTGNWTHFTNRLFNVAADPREEKDLFSSKPEKVAELAAKLAEISADRFIWPGHIHRLPRGKARNVTTPEGKLRHVWFPWIEDEETL